MQECIDQMESMKEEDKMIKVACAYANVFRSGTMSCPRQWTRKDQIGLGYGLSCVTLAARSGLMRESLS
jgi:hypothetical protein